MANPTADWKQKLVLQMASEERASVTPLTDGHYQLVLPLHEGGRLILIALGMLPALTRTQPGAAQEQVRLLKWLQSVQVRLRGSNQTMSRARPETKPESGVSSAWEGLLALDQLSRRLRTHKETAKYQRRIL